MSKDYVLANDSQFRDWLTNFITFANAHLADLDLVAGDITALSTQKTAFSTALDAHIAAQAAAKAASETKDEERVNVISVLRPLVRRIQAYEGTTDALREGLGITVPDRSKTPVPPPTTSPLGVVEVTERYTHVLRIADSASPTRFAKPDGVIGAEVLCKIGGEAPTGDEGMTSLGIATKAKFTKTFTNADGNKTAWYALRWVGTRGEKGPIGETIAATIAA